MFRLLKKKWKVLREIAYILSIPYKATLDLQKQTLTLSDVFGIWMKIQFHLKVCVEKPNYETELSTHMLATVTERKDCIFKNPAMASALFLDPRFRREILRDSHKVDEAKKTLQNIWRRLIKLRADATMETPVNQSMNSSGSDISFEYNATADLDNFLRGTQNELINTNALKSTEVDIDHLLDVFDPDIISSSSNVLEYWEQNKNDNVHLYELATVVFAVPPTEVQIERDFSALNFVFSDRRCALTEERLEDIMVIHLNKELFHEVKTEQSS